MSQPGRAILLAIGGGMVGAWAAPVSDRAPDGDETGVARPEVADVSEAKNKLESESVSLAALVPICLEQSRKDPEVTETLAQLKEASSYQRSDMLMKAGWATMPGSSDPNRNVARACMERLATQF